MPRWISSSLIVLGSALFLGLTIRGTGPSGPGVGPMLRMQTTWQGSPAIHAEGRLYQTMTGKTREGHFELWESGGAHRKVTMDWPGSPPTTIIVRPDTAWKKTGGHTPETLAPDHADLFPIPDPDAPDNTYYRQARYWSIGPERTIGDVKCQELIGRANGAWFYFDVSETDHLPRQVIIVETPLQGSPTPAQVWRVQFDSISVVNGLSPSIFDKPA